MWTSCCIRLTRTLVQAAGSLRSRSTRRRRLIQIPILAEASVGSDVLQPKNVVAQLDSASWAGAKTFDSAKPAFRELGWSEVPLRESPTLLPRIRMIPRGARGLADLQASSSRRRQSISISSGPRLR